MVFIEATRNQDGLRIGRDKLLDSRNIIRCRFANGHIPLLATFMPSKEDYQCSTMLVGRVRPLFFSESMMRGVGLHRLQILVTRER